MKTARSAVSTPTSIASRYATGSRVERHLAQCVQSYKHNCSCFELFVADLAGALLHAADGTG